MRSNNFPDSLLTRTIAYNQILWDDFQGIDEQQILSDLPSTMRVQIKTSLFKPLIQNWEAFPKDN